VTGRDGVRRGGDARARAGEREAVQCSDPTDCPNETCPPGCTWPPEPDPPPKGGELRVRFAVGCARCECWCVVDAAGPSGPEYMGRIANSVVVDGSVELPDGWRLAGTPMYALCPSHAGEAEGA
jgi:hypothetical protein